MGGASVGSSGSNHRSAEHVRIDASYVATAWEVLELGWSHYGSIGAVICALCGEDDFRRYMRRLAFMVLSGNADAHLKNWSLLHPDGVNARLGLDGRVPVQ